MRIALALVGLAALAACQSIAERDCIEQGHEKGTTAFTECVADRRTQEGMRIKEQGARGTGRGRLGQ